MEQSIQEALVVLAVGMTTVFLILALVVGSGHFLIRLLNRFDWVFNDPLAGSSLQRSASVTATTKESDVEVLIEKAIQQWSDGKAKITKIK